MGSHSTHDGKEIVLFNADLILPCYIVHYSKKTQHLNRNYYGVDKTPTAPAKAFSTGYKSRSYYEDDEDEYDEEDEEDRYYDDDSGEYNSGFS